MKKLVLYMVFMLLFSLLTALEFHSQMSGDWSEPLTWGSFNGVPGYGDNVYIHPGHVISTEGNNEIYIQSLDIYDNGFESGSLYGGYATDITLHVERDVYIESSSGSQTVTPGPWGEFHLYVGGNFFMYGGWDL